MAKGVKEAFERSARLGPARQRDRIRVLAVLVLLMTGCKDAIFTESMRLGGRTIGPEVLNEGRRAYMTYCWACHGTEGRGDGPSATSLTPAPRDLSQGVFKFGGVAAGELPNDDDILRLLRRGLEGTAMLPWDVPEPQLVSIIQYMKTLSPRFRTEQPGVPILPTGDPYGDRSAQGAQRGKVVYHAVAQCARCHPSYVDSSELAAMSEEVGRAPDRAGDLLAPIAGQPPATDLRIGPIKNGTSLDELYRTIACGVGGTQMPAWKESLPEDDLWALVHYVESISR